MAVEIELGRHREPSSIRDLRRRLGWTQIDLAEALDVDQGTVSHWERSVDLPRPSRLAALRELLVREDEDRAKSRSQTRLRHSLQPAVFVNERAQLQFFNQVAAKRYRDAHGLDLKAHIGFEFQRHSAILSAEQSWQEFVRSGFLRGDLLLARFSFNANGAGHVTEYEPFFDAGKLSGFGATVVGTLRFPATQGFTGGAGRRRAARRTRPHRGYPPGTVGLRRMPFMARDPSSRHREWRRHGGRPFLFEPSSSLTMYRAVTLRFVVGEPRRPHSLARVTGQDDRPSAIPAARMGTSQCARQTVRAARRARIAGADWPRRKRIFVTSHCIRSAAIVTLLFAYHLILVRPRAQRSRRTNKSEWNGAIDRRHATPTTSASAGYLVGAGRHPARRRRSGASWRILNPACTLLDRPSAARAHRGRLWQSSEHLIELINVSNRRPAHTAIVDVNRHQPTERKTQMLHTPDTSSARPLRAGVALAATVVLGLASSAVAQDSADLVSACSDAARQYFENFDAATDMRVDDPRVDGSRTSGGTIDLGTYVAEVRCGFPADALRLTEFYVDGADVLADLQAGHTVSGGGDMPNYDRPVGGVLPEGSGFTASSIIPCERPGTGAAQCDAGVVREGNGNGFVMVFWPDAGSRVLYFEDGTIMGYDQSEADGGAELSATRNGDIQVVTVGDARFEVFDALLVGG